MALTLAVATEGAADRTTLICKCLDRSAATASAVETTLVVHLIDCRFVDTAAAHPPVLSTAADLHYYSIESDKIYSSHLIIKRRLKDDDDHSSSNDARNAK